MESESSTTNLVNTLKQTIPESFTPDSFTPDSFNSTEDTTSSFFPKMILIIILFAFIGGGVFIYLAKGDKSLREFVTPYLNKLGIDIGTDKDDDDDDNDTTTYETTTTTMYDKKDTTTYDRDTTTSRTHMNYGRTGATGPARPTPMDTTIDTTTTIDTRTTTTPIYTTTTTRKTETKDDAAVECDNPQKEKLMKALNNAVQTADYMADDASSSIQCVNKSKWCFIGEEKGVRNCVLLNDDQKCMSGDIFPSRDICINPKMRS
jgi:hypothetical protein